MSCTFNVSLLLFILAIALTRAERARSTETASSKDVTSSTRHMWCPYKCKCNAFKREVNCAYKKLTQLPKDIPVSTRTLILTGNKLKHIPKRAFWMLRHLETLKLNGNHLDFLTNRAFQHLRKLKELDLSSNKLEALPIRAFRKLGNLQILRLRNNKLGKLPISVFSGLSNLIEVDLSANFLQTLELELFDGLASLKELYLDGNKWHCDCSLKNTEVGLRQLQVRTGYIVCDSPNKLAGHHLKEKLTNSLCARKNDDLVYILLGVTCGVLAILFAIFMCRRRMASNIDAHNSIRAEIKHSTSRRIADTYSRSSVVYDSETDTTAAGQMLQQPTDKNLDFLKASRELNEDILPLTNHTVYDAGDRQGDVRFVSSSTKPTMTSSSSCPNLLDIQSELDRFTKAQI